MKASTACFIFSIASMLCMGASCVTPPKPPVAGPTPTAKGSPVPDAMAKAKAEAQAALDAVEKKVVVAQAELAALEKRASVAAAQVESLRTANTNQPPSPATTVVEGEAALALGNLPKPDVQAALEAEKRRSATFAGQADEARRLYAAAQTETERLKGEASKLKSDAAAAKVEADSAKLRAEGAQAALVEAEKNREAQLKANQAANQAKLDAAEARAKKAQDDLLDAERRKDALWLRLAGVGLLLVGIGIGVFTNGLQLGKSIGFGVGSAACFALAQIVAHPWFMRVSLGCVVLAVCGGAYWFWREREDALKKSAMEKQVAELDKVDLRAVPTTDDKGRPSNLAIEFDRVMDKPEKSVVKKMVFAKTVKEAKAEAA